MPKLVRYEDWPERLNDFIDLQRNKPFVWGENDCCIFAANCIQAITGEDLATSYRGKYQSKQRLARILLIRGYTDFLPLIEEIATASNLMEIPIRLAQRGDVVQFDSPNGIALGVCTGNHVIAPGPMGLHFAGVHTLYDKPNTRAWRI